MLALDIMSKNSGIRSILSAFKIIDGFNMPSLKISVLSSRDSIESIVLNVSDLAPLSTVNYFAESDSHFSDELDVNNIRTLPLNSVSQNIPDLGILVGDLEVLDEPQIAFIKASGQVLIVPKDDNQLVLWRDKLDNNQIDLKEYELSEKLSPDRISKLKEQGISTSTIFIKN